MEFKDQLPISVKLRLLNKLDVFRSYRCRRVLTHEGRVPVSLHTPVVNKFLCDVDKKMLLE